MLSHQGNFSFKMIGELLKDLCQKMDEMDLSVSYKKAIYSIMVECLENIYRHYEMNSSINKNVQKIPHFTLQIIENEEFLLTSGNPIVNSKIEGLKKRIDWINEINQKELKEQYRNTLKKLNLSTRQGAGIGIIAIVKLAGNKIKYHFEPLNEDISYFTMTIKISKYKKQSV